MARSVDMPRPRRHSWIRVPHAALYGQNVMRMRRCLRISLICLLSALVACSGSEPRAAHTGPAHVAGRPPAAIPSTVPGVQPAETVTTVTADSPMTTPFGATYTAPKGWTVTARGGVVILQDP